MKLSMTAKSLLANCYIRTFVRAGTVQGEDVLVKKGLIERTTCFEFGDSVVLVCTVAGAEWIDDNAATDADLVRWGVAERVAESKAVAS